MRFSRQVVGNLRNKDQQDVLFSRNLFQ